MWNIRRSSRNNILEYDEEIYESLQNDDHSEVVMKLYEKEKYIGGSLEKKTEEKSDTYRRQGSTAFKLQNVQQALIFYNMALCYAPKNSRALKLAYNNRSELLYELKEFKAALSDIEICYKLDCSNYLKQKLKVREVKCHENALINDYKEFVRNELVSSVDFLSLGPQRSDGIPCASKAVKLDTSGTKSRFVAAENINVGTVVALETAYVNTSASQQDEYLICYHCMKSSFNLIPCDDCCLVMFCEEECKEASFNEYHAIECKLLQKEYIGKINLGLKSMIKMRNSFVDWRKFVEATNGLSTKQTEKLKDEKTFSQTNPFSLFYNTKDIYVPFGRKIHYAYVTFVLIKQLEALESYFPSAQDEKILAIRATAKLLMHLFLYSREIILLICIALPTHQLFEAHATKGFYVFLGQLEHSCHPNLIFTPVKDKAVVTAIQPIRRGTPLTISYIDHYSFNNNALNKPIQTYLGFSTVCSCKVCTEKWGENYTKNYSLSAAQKRYLKENDIKNIIETVRDHGLNYAYEKTCLGLELFTDLPNTTEYKEIYMAFFEVQQVLHCAMAGSENKLDE